MEALACGCPAVATDVGSVATILSEDFLGTIVANNDHSLASGLIPRHSPNRTIGRGLLHKCYNTIGMPGRSG